jgi:rhodanese-related sulfurtransferase
MKSKTKFLWLLMPFLFSSGVFAVEDGFPGRGEYPDVLVYEKSQLFNDFSDVILVDTRSKYEYETLRIKGAVNIPVSSKDFGVKLKQLRATTSKPIVFYCNGRTCLKSYIAGREANNLNVEDTYAYDAGVFEWAKTYPNHAALLGKSPIDPRDIISAKKFTSHLLEPDKFSEKAYQMRSTSMVIDVRDRYQRAGTGLFPAKERWVSLDDQKKLQKYIKQAKAQNKTLFIYDEVGKQVRWFQYALEKANVKKYYFMKKGARRYYDDLMVTQLVLNDRKQ